METSPSFAGPFALGTFSAGDGPAFPGLVAHGRVLDLRTVPELDLPEPTTRALLERWDDVLPLLTEAAGAAAGEWRPWSELRVHAPVEPRQMFQAGRQLPHPRDRPGGRPRPPDGRPPERGARARPRR